MQNMVARGCLLGLRTAELECEGAVLMDGLGEQQQEDFKAGQMALKIIS